MGLRSLLASALVFAILLAVAWWILAREDAPPPRPFFALSRRIPDTLTVITGLDTTVVVPGGEAGWRVLRPVPYPADAVVVEAMVKRLADLEVDRRFPLTREKMDSYGMRIPRGVIRAAYREGTPADTLTIGSFTFDDVHDYVRSGTRNEVGLLPSRVARGYLLKSTVELRENRLLPFPETLATEFQLLGALDEVRVEVRRDPEGAWRVIHPYPGPAAGRKVGEYLESLSHMHVRSFIREAEGPLAPYGLDRPAVGVQVRLEDGSTFGAHLGDRIPGTDLVYAVSRDRPTVFGVSDKYPPVLRWEADRFRRPALVGFGLAQVTRVDVDRAASRRSFDLGAGADSLRREVRDVLGNWVLIEARRFEEATPQRLRECGLARPVRSLWWWSGPDTLARVDLGPPRGGETPVRVSEGSGARPSEILFVSEDMAEPLFRFLVDSPGPP